MALKDNAEITVLVRNGQFTNLILDALLRAGFEFKGKSYTHGGRELHLMPPNNTPDASGAPSGVTSE